MRTIAVLLFVGLALGSFGQGMVIGPKFASNPDVNAMDAEWTARGLDAAR